MNISQSEIDQFNSMTNLFEQQGVTDSAASLGAAGIMRQQLQAIQDNTEAVAGLTKQERDSNGRFVSSGSSPIRPPQMQWQEDEYVPLVEQLKGTVFTVRVSNAFNEIVDPMYRRMQLISVDERLHTNKLHLESKRQRREMIRALEHLTSKGETSLRSLYLSFQDFMRFPVWNTLRFIGNSLRTTVSGILFGFKKRKSDTDRIVEAISKQTEFLRTGAIDNTNGFFVRMWRQGIMGMPVKAIGESLLEATTGISRSRAQNREDARARGEQGDSRWGARMSTLMYLRSLNLRGTNAGASGGLDQDPKVSLLTEIRDILLGFKQDVSGMFGNVVDIGGAFASAIINSQVQQHTLLYQQSVLNHLSVIGSNTQLLTHQNAQSIGDMLSSSPLNVSMVNMAEITKGNERMKEVIVAMAEENSNWQKRSYDQQQKTGSTIDREFVSLNDIGDTLKKSTEHEKDQVKWLKRLRDGQIWQTIMKGASIALNGIRTVLGTISNTLLGIAGTVAAILKLRRLGGFGNSTPDIDPSTGKPKPKGKNPKGGMIKRALDFLKKNATKAAPVVRKGVSMVRAVPGLGTMATVATGASLAGQMLAPDLASPEAMKKRYVAPPDSNQYMSRPADGLALPNDGGQFVRDAKAAKEQYIASQNTKDVTPRIGDSVDGLKESMKSLGDKLDSLYDQKFKKFFSSNSIDTNNVKNAIKDISAKYDASYPQLDKVLSQVKDEMKSTYDSGAKKSEDLLKKVEEHLRKLVENDNKRGTDSSPIVHFPSGTNHSIYGD